MSYLDRIKAPEDVKALGKAELPQLAEEIRKEIIRVVARTGGHLSSNLGVVELTIALLYVFDSPTDTIVWDVGHQSYPFKLLTGRRDRFETLRQFKGLSGFPKRSESPHDAFDTGHSGTSISAALGIAKAKERNGEPGWTIAVIGDGSMTSGLAFEGLNQAGDLKQKVLVVLNDNEMSIGNNVGALASYMGRIITGQVYKRLKNEIMGRLETFPRIGKKLAEGMRRTLESTKGLLVPGILFEEMGFKYVGPVDGHQFGHLIETLENVKRYSDEPALLHVTTRKGRGYGPAEKDPESFHGASPFDIETGKFKKKDAPPSYTSVCGKTLVELAENDPRVFAITAAMGLGTGLKEFEARFPERFCDVGIAEEHAVTFAAGLASRGLRPVVSIYSTFLQRAFDQIVHDVCLTRLPVIFCLDRAGLVGEDGPTHHGAFDLAYLRTPPHVILMAPKDENELRRMLKTALEHDGPSVIRYPRGAGEGVPFDEPLAAIPIGTWEILAEGHDLIFLAVGRMVGQAMKARERLEREFSLSAGVVNARFIKPLDSETLARIALASKNLVTLEEGTLKGGFGSAVLEELAELQITHVDVLRLGLPDRYIEHGSVAELWKTVGLDLDSILSSIRERFAFKPKLRKIHQG